MTAGIGEMSYKQKCLEIDSWLRCERFVRWDGGRMIITVYVVMSGFNPMANGPSAASAWRDAWERLNAKNKN